MTLRLKKNPKKTLINIILYFTLFIGFFTYNFNVPNSILYLADFLNVLLIILSLKKIKVIFSQSRIKTIIYLLTVLVLIGTISAFTYGFKINLYVWAIRNWGRLFSFFLVCICNLDKRDIDETMSFLMGFIHINTIVVIFQYLFLSDFYSQDALNGLFGRNTSSIFVTVLLIVTVLVFSKYFSKKIKGSTLVLFLIEICICAVIAEIKAIFFFIIILLAAYIFSNAKLTKSKLIKYTSIVIIGFLAVYLFAYLLGKLYSEFAGFLSISRLLKDANAEGGYGHQGYIDRLSGISVINKYFFNQMGLKYKLFGLGIGNAEYSSFSSFTSAFYNRFGREFFYLNFTSSALYMEVGIVGLVLYAIIFIIIILDCYKRIKYYIKNNKSSMSFYEQVGFGIALLALIFIIYNNLQRTDASFVLAYFLSIPFVAFKNEKNNYE